MTDRGETVEFQLSAERDLATDPAIDTLRRLTRRGIDQMLAAQRVALGQASPAFLGSVLAS
jgi:hypothetical protein